MSEIASRVKKIIVDKLGVDEADVLPEASFTNDLGADSLDTTRLVRAVRWPRGRQRVRPPCRPNRPRSCRSVDWSCWFNAIDDYGFMRRAERCVCW